MNLGRCLRLVLAFATTSAWLQTSASAQGPLEADGLRTGLADMVSLLTLGGVSVSSQTAQVTQSGSEVYIRLPLNGWAAPANAAAEAVAQPDRNGGWTITSMTFPASGAVGDSVDQVVSYAIGQQAAHGRLDPTVATPSTLTTELSAVTLQPTAGATETTQAIDQITLDARMVATADRRLDLLAQDTATNWHVMIRDPSGQQATSLVRSVSGRIALFSLDHAQGERLMTRVRSFMATAKTHKAANVQERAADLSPAERDDLRAVLDACAGLLTRAEADETLESLRYDLGGGKTGTLGSLQLQARSDFTGQHLNAAVNIVMDGFSLAALAANTATFVPHHLVAKAAIAGIPLGPLTALLQASLAPHPDQPELQRQATALLAIPGARAAIESIAFDAGPVQVSGSVRFQPRADGEIGADIHILARGVDALLVRAQSQPELQGIMPFVAMAKGLGHVEGDSIVWDIALGGGPLTINGIPFGQPSATTR